MTADGRFTDYSDESDADSEFGKKITEEDLEKFMEAAEELEHQNDEERDKFVEKYTALL